MKKIIAILMCMLLLTMCFVSCKDDEVTENTDTQEVSDTVADESGSDTNDDGGNKPDNGNTNDTVNDGIGEAGDNNSEGNWTKPY